MDVEVPMDQDQLVEIEEVVTLIKTEDDKEEIVELIEIVDEPPAKPPCHCYCKTYELDVNNMVQCSSCKIYFHQDCLKSGRFSQLLGDRFIQLTCANCHPEDEEISRRPLTWATAVCIALYNLHMNGSSNRMGYFQWREQVCRFIEERWMQFFPDRKKAPKWQGAVACTLSTNAGSVFRSGIHDVGEPGWWKLIENVPPDPNTVVVQKTKKRKTPVDLSTLVGLGPRVRKKAVLDNVYQSAAIPSSSRRCSAGSLKDGVEETTGVGLEVKAEPVREDSMVGSVSDGAVSYAEAAKDVTSAEEVVSAAKEPLKLQPMSSKQLLSIMTRLENYARKGNDLGPSLTRYLNKLRVRLLKLSKGLPVFNLDAHVAQLCNGKSEDTNIIDRFVHTGVIGSAMPATRTSFATKILGNCTVWNTERFNSPYTQRTLKPFIFRESTSLFHRTRLLQEICSHRLSSHLSTEPYQPRNIYYMYVRPHHIPVINSICSSFFWDNIDLTGSLSYPEFSIVGLFGKLVVSFAFMVPLAERKEAYITFLWTHPHFRRNGIARFMLYHLVQSCMGKDITLHVSVDNPAVFLYQSFGFRTEKLSLNFYEKYLPSSSKEAKHALYMRLTW